VRGYLACVIVAGGALACGPSASEKPADVALCPMMIPTSCPSPQPSFATDVEPIVAKRCYPCHGPGGVEQATDDFSTYQGLSLAKTEVELTVYGCIMPPSDAGAATAAERLAILSWGCVRWTKQLIPASRRARREAISGARREEG
jgi:cytochrome c553